MQLSIISLFKAEVSVSGAVGGKGIAERVVFEAGNANMHKQLVPLLP